MFFVDLTMLDQLEEHGPAWKFDDARFLEEAVSDPDVIFEGLQRHNLADCFCYCLQPRQDPDAPADEVPPLFARVFVAFVRPGVSGGPGRQIAIGRSITRCASSMRRMCAASLALCIGAAA